LALALAGGCPLAEQQGEDRNIQTNIGTYTGLLLFKLTSTVLGIAMALWSLKCWSAECVRGQLRN
jgi:hypothetical protein